MAESESAKLTSKRTCSTLATALVLASVVAGCRRERDRDPREDDPPEESETAFVEAGTDTNAAETDAQLLTSSLVSASTSGSIGLASVELTGQDLRTRDIGDGATAIFLPRGCLAVRHDAAAQTVVYTFQRCLGPSGLRGVTGTVTARYRVAPNQLHLELTAEDLAVNDATMDWSATTDVVADGADRTMTWKAQLSGVTAGGRSFARTNEHTLSWKIGEPCLAVSGSSEGVVRGSGRPEAEGREIRTDIFDFRRCRGGCPEPGGRVIVTNVSTSQAVEVQYDGTNQATVVGPNGRTAKVPLFCRP